MVDRLEAIRECNIILNKAKISPRLRDAVEAIRAALINNNLYLATELSAVKSYITGSMDSKSMLHKVEPFREDEKYNEARLGSSVYSILDGMHHELAWALGQMPSGVIIMNLNTGNIKKRHEIPANASSILEEMKRQHDELRRYFGM